MIPHSGSWKTAAALASVAALCACGEHEAANNSGDAGASPPPPTTASWAMGAAAGVGKPFGARDPRTCPTISSGKLTQPEAQQVFICDTEHASGDGSSLTLVSDVTFNLGAARRSNTSDKTMDPDLNANWLVYPVFGSYHGFSCLALGPPAALGGNCTLSVHAKAVGSCYMTEQAGWRCAMADPAPTVQPHQPPPPGG